MTETREPLGEPNERADRRRVSSLDRAQGALLGLAAGDAVGTTLEFKAPGTFEPITDLVGGGPFRLQPGQWTDDTSMGLCLAESLLDRDGHDPADQLRRYLLWREEGYFSSTGSCFDIGITTRTQLDRFRRTAIPVDPKIDEESAANGSLMRLAAVPIRWHRNLDLAIERAADSSRTTHPATSPVDTCRVHATMVAALIAGASWSEVTDPRFWRWGPLHPAVDAIARGSWTRRQPPQIRGTGYCVDALEAAIWAVDGADDFRSAVLRAANLGYDADTTAAIAGQLAGARWGASGIPAHWLDQLTSVGRIRSLAGALHDAESEQQHAQMDTWPHEDLVHAWWVDQGLLAGEYPGTKGDEERARDKVNALIDAGVRTFIDLTEHRELDAYDHHVTAAAKARNLDLRYERFPIPDLGVVADDAYDEVLQRIGDARDRGVVYLHCWGGVGRTGTVVGCVLVAQGNDYDAVLETLVQRRAGTRKANRRSPETGPQLELLRRRAATRS